MSLSLVLRYITPLHRPSLRQKDTDRLGTSKIKTPLYKSSQADKDHNKEQHSANTSSVNLYAGVNLVKLFTPSSKHSAVPGVLGAIGLYDSSKMSSNGKDMSIDLRYGSLWSYGARAAYAYMITEKVGAGLSATYDLGQDNFYGLANLIIRF